MKGRGSFLDAPTDKGAMEPWITTILQNTFRDHWRHTSKNVEDGGEEAQDTAEITPSPSMGSGDTLDQRRTVQRTLDIMSGLPPRQRQAMELTAMGKGEGEVATEMGTKVGTVKTHIFRGRENLLNQLEQGDVDIVNTATNLNLRKTRVSGDDKSIET